MTSAVLTIVIFALLFFSMVLAFIRSGRFIRNFIYSAVTGLLGLGATYAVGLFTAPLLVISPLSIVLSVLLGLPGVISLLLINILI